MRAGGGRGAHVVLAPRRVERIDAHDALTMPEAAGDERLRDLIAREGLLVRRDSVLAVQQQHVGIERARLLESTSVRSGEVQSGAAGSRCG
jgi:hypothetical protein